MKGLFGASSVFCSNAFLIGFTYFGRVTDLLMALFYLFALFTEAAGCCGMYTGSGQRVPMSCSQSTAPKPAGQRAFPAGLLSHRSTGSSQKRVSPGDAGSGKWISGLGLGGVGSWVPKLPSSAQSMRARHWNELSGTRNCREPLNEAAWVARKAEGVQSSFDRALVGEGIR